MKLSKGFQLSASREKNETTTPGKQESSKLQKSKVKPVEEDLKKTAKIADNPKKVLFKVENKDIANLVSSRR